MNRYFAVVLILLAASLYSCKEEQSNNNYKSNPSAFNKNAFIRLPLGSVRPAGWLRSQLEAQASGLTGHLDNYWPDLLNSAWKGGDGDAWERGPYYLDGLVPLAYILDNDTLINKVKKWMLPIIRSSSDSGWYGPAKNRDRWPLAVANKVLMQYYEGSGDTSALNVLRKYFRFLHDTPPDWPDKDWRGVRAMENAVTGYWLYRQTGEEWIKETLESIQKNSSDWTSYYEKFPWDSAASADRKIPLNWGADGLTAHVVNNAMAVKYPGLWYQQSMDERFKKASLSAIEKYNINHGQAGGRFSGDEHLSGKSPDRGTELCSVVEYMFSLEELYEILGDNSLADRLELLAYNSLPGTTTPDMWAHQYDQQSNQVLVSSAKRGWSTNGDDSNIYGFSPNFGCCLANMHQGWPKFVASMWMATNDNGLALVAYGPCKVNAMVARGKKITIEENTEYPFRGTITLTINTTEPVKFPLTLRIPSWAGSMLIKFRDKEINAKGFSYTMNEKWKDGDIISISMPMEIRTEKRYNNSISLLRGPLYYSLRIGKQFNPVRIKYDNYGFMGSIDWQITPTGSWNYGLIFDNRNPTRGLRIIENPIGRYPFADKDDMVWNADSACYSPSQTESPVVIKLRGMKIPSWTMVDNSAAVPPVSPVEPAGDIEQIELVPYGCARLRITEFPVMDITLMEDVMRPGR